MFLTGILAFLLFSCAELLPEIDYIEYIDNVVYINFLAQDLRYEDSFYNTPAGMYAIGKYCTLWIEKNTAISKDDVKKIINEFDNYIYPKMTAVFGTNCLNAVDVDDDGKICILLLDIKDSYQPGGGNESAVGGYFDFWDILDADSNLRDMIYIDTYPGRPGSADSNMTLAHEMQHLMNFGYAVIRANYNPNNVIASMMDVWIDEGLSVAAEWIYSGSHPTNRWGWYHNNGNGRTGSARIQSDIDKGNNFYVWGNRTTNIYAEMDDYATAYLFFQWLRIQSNGNAIYRDIIGSPYSNFRAVTSAAASKISSDYNNNNWSNLLRDWLAANYINSATSRYGYKNDSTLRALNKHFYTASGTTPLWPGEGVFSKINSSFNVPSDSGNLKYYNLTSTDPVKTQINSGALLSYNDNTALNGSAANGTVTGVAASVSVDVSVNGRFIAAPLTLSGPYWVSGGDVLRRNGNARDSSGVPRSSIRIRANE
jgi:hypothetical protein